MSNVTATFVSDERKITINFVHNVETETLDYNVNVEPPINEGDPVDLATIFADKFLGSLIAPDIEVIPEEDSVEDESENANI